MNPPETIWRFALPIADRSTLPMPRGTIILGVGPPRPGIGVHDRPPPLDMWGIVDPTAAHEPREFVIVGTGNPMPADAGRWVGTTHSHSGSLIWHVFEVRA